MPASRYRAGFLAREAKHYHMYDMSAPVTYEDVGSIPGQTHSSCDRGRLSLTA
jgi:hypothetical protein